VKLGTENRKQVLALAVLGVIAVLVLAYEFLPSSSTPTSAAAPASSTGPGHPTMRRTASGKLVPVVEPRLDPTLDLKLLAQSEEINYAGNGRNIFVNRPVEIETPRASGATDHGRQAGGIYMPPPPPPPPPITLKFCGFANKTGEPKKVFLVQNEDIFVAGEGEIVDRRYRVLRISPNAVEIEDVLNNNKQSIPLTQG
jgi:hypothetical protein